MADEVPIKKKLIVKIATCDGSALDQESINHFIELGYEVQQVPIEEAVEHLRQIELADRLELEEYHRSRPDSESDQTSG